MFSDFRQHFCSVSVTDKDETHHDTAQRAPHRCQRRLGCAWRFSAPSHGTNAADSSQSSTATRVHLGEQQHRCRWAWQQLKPAHERCEKPCQWIAGCLGGGAGAGGQTLPQDSLSLRLPALPYPINDPTAPSFPMGSLFSLIIGAKPSSKEFPKLQRAFLKH